VANVTVGFDPDSVTYASDTDRVYVADGYPYNVSVIDAGSDTVVGSIAAAGGPDGIAYDNDSGDVYVVESAGNVADINRTTQTVSRFLSLDPGPKGVAWDPTTRNMYVSTWFSGVVDEVGSGTNQLLGSEPLWYGLSGITADNATGDLYVTCWSCATVYDIGGAGAVTRAVGVGEWPTSVAYDANARLVFVSNFLSNTVSVIDPQDDTLLSTICLSSGICYDGSGGGGGPESVAFDPSNGSVYVAVHGDVNGDPGNITILNGSTGAPIGAFHVPPWGGPGPSSLLIDSANNELYVTDDWSNLLWAFNLTTEAAVSEVAVGRSPEYVALDPLNGYLYVTNSGSDNVSVINSTNNAVVGSIAVGSDPLGIGFDPANGWMYAANQGSGTLSVIGQPTYPVTFDESGLPGGTTWSIDLAGTTNHSLTPIIGFVESNGPYGFTVGPVPGFTSSPSSGTITVSGAPQAEEITFTLAIAPLTASLVADPDNLTIGASTVLTTTTEGGTPPFSYVYIGLPPGCKTSNLSALPCSPTGVGTFAVTVAVTDSAGTQATGYATVRVQGSTSSPSGLTPADWTAVAVVILGALIGVLYFMTSRRKPRAVPPHESGRPPPPALPPSRPP
jgi:YVTN family beta-propeller protein